MSIALLDGLLHSYGQVQCIPFSLAHELWCQQKKQSKHNVERVKREGNCFIYYSFKGKIIHKPARYQFYPSNATRERNHYASPSNPVLSTVRDNHFTQFFHSSFYYAHLARIAITITPNETQAKASKRILIGALRI